MEWITCPVGPIQANCYLLHDQTTGECLIIDPGAAFEKIKTIIDREKFHPIAILLTHAHFDHIGALDKARDEWNIPMYLHSEESDWPQNPMKNGSAHFSRIRPVIARKAEHMLSDHDKLLLGPFSCLVLHTPGHSPGGVSFYFEDERTVFCGDALFHGSIGRTDQYGGDQDQLLASIHDQLLTLPEDTIACPGHGPQTTIGEEANSNPFLI